MTEWTGAQLAAITGRAQNLLVAAAAGAGKTAVLVERIVRRITDPADPVDVDRFLVVTFTNLAAAQMRQRIGDTLACSAQTRRQLLLLNMAAVTTLHSFCLDLVRSYYYRLGLPPGFRVAAEDEAALIRENALEAVLERWYERGGALFAALADDYGGEKGDEQLARLILRLYDFSRSHPDPAAWLAGVAAAFAGEGDPSFGGPVRESIGLALAEAADLLAQAARWAGGPGGPAVWAPTLAGDLAMIEDLRADRPFAQLRAALHAAGWSRLPACRGGDTERKERVRAARDKAKATVRDVAGRFLAREPAEFRRDLVQLAPVVGTLVEVVGSFAAAYREAKLARGLVDFADLEHLALSLLAGPSALALSLRRRYAEVLVDEYQDINPVQEAILQLVARPPHPVPSPAGRGPRPPGEEPNLFMVGDVKQSIYRFRLAEPGLFLGKYRRFSPRPDAAERRIDLPQNFRSRPEIIRAVNFLFRQIMTETAGEMTYGKEAELACGLVYPAPPPGAAALAGPVELHLLEPPDQNGESAEREAALVAGRIREMMAAAPVVWADGRFRPLAWRDVVVLLRSVRGAAEGFLYEFRRRGVPATADSGPGYLAATEVETMLALLQVIDNPLADVPLAAVLRSALVGLTADELAGLRMAAPEGPFHQAVFAAVPHLAGDLADKVADFAARLAGWRRAARQGRLSDLIWRIYRETGFYDQAGAMPGGRVRQANLRSLYDRACQYEKTSFSSLFDFLRYVQRLRDAEPAAPGEDDLVRIMSVHKAKGLEFPVVFLAGLGRSFNLQDVRAQTVLHKDLGIGPDVVDRELGVRYPSWAKLAIREKLRRESLAEEMRILYVALTRAREKLVLVGSAGRLAARVKEWGASLDWPRVTLPDSRLLAAGGWLDWIGPAVLRHREAAGLAAWGGVEGEAVPAVREDPSTWLIRCPAPVPPAGESPPADGALPGQVRRGEPLAVSPAAAAAVAARLSWTYPHPVGRPAKIGVTEWKRPPGPADETAQAWFRSPAVPRPRFLQAAGRLSELERGEAWHQVLQHLDLAGDLSPRGIAAQMQVMQENLLLSAPGAAVVDPDILADLFSGPLGRRLVGRRVRRELPFSLLLSAGEVYPELAGGEETVLVQGVIDCLVEEGDGFLLVDWKSEVRPDPERYRQQLDIYARAVETVFGRPVREKYLYFLAARQAVRLD